MTTWIKLLPLEISNITEMWEPEQEVDEAFDHPVGEMSDDLRKLFSLWRQTQKCAEQLILEARYSHNADEQKSLGTRAFEIQKKAEVLREIFWISVRDEFGLWNKDAIGVCRGYLVIWSDKKPMTFLDFLGGG